MQKTVLVTGAAGFIGRNVARHYADAGWAVTGIGHGSWAEEAWQSQGFSAWHGADITLENLRAYAGEPAVIIHCAGSGTVGFSMAHPAQDFQRTVATTAAVLEFVRILSPASRVVIPSSASVYGAAATLPICESSPLSPVSPYGSHKRMAEELCQSYARNFGIATVVVRLFSVYGPGLRKQLLWDACTRIARGENGFFGSGQETRDWLHIDDAAALLMSAGELASPACRIVNGGAGEEVAVREVLGELFAAFGRSGPPTFTGVARMGDPERYRADISIARSWGWRPEKQWREGVREYAAWFKGVQP